MLPTLTAAERDDISRQVAYAGHGVLRGKGYINYAVALAAARIIEAIVYDEHQVMPVSSLMTGYAGISDKPGSDALRSASSAPRLRRLGAVLMGG